MFFVTLYGLYHWRSGKAIRVTLPLAAGDIPRAGYRDRQHRVWLGTDRQVLQWTAVQARGEDESHEWIVLGPVTRPVNVLLGDAVGRLWIGTLYEGLWQLAPSQHSVRLTSRKWRVRDGLPDDTIRSLFTDVEQNLWVGMLTGGSSRWRKASLAPFGGPEGFRFFFTAKLLSNPNHTQFRSDESATGTDASCLCRHRSGERTERSSRWCSSQWQRAPKNRRFSYLEFMGVCLKSPILVSDSKDWLRG
jgi:hypothetical protein